MTEQESTLGREHDIASSTPDAFELRLSSGSAKESDPPVPWSPGALSGRRLGDYQLDTLLAVGGMAEVYLADDLVLARAVAVKVLTSARLEGDESVARFQAEARHIAAFTHPHIVAIYQAGEVEVNGRRLPYLVMPLLNESLRDLLNRSKHLPPADAVWLALQVAEGLAAAHRRGLVHRDVKPENILLDAEGQASLADFGIASEIEAEQRREKGLSSNRHVLGTLQYMAPEQLRSDPIDQRVDIYSLGVVLYELLTGALPFGGGTSYDYAYRALHDAPTPPSTYVDGLPVALDTAILKALARDPAERYSTVGEFALDLRRAITRQLPSLGNATPPFGVEMLSGIVSSPIDIHPIRTNEFALSGRTDASSSATRRKRRLIGVLSVAAVVLLIGSLITFSLIQYGEDSLTGPAPNLLGGFPFTQTTGVQSTSRIGQASPTTGPRPGQSPVTTSASGTSPGTVGTPTASATAAETPTAAAAATATSAPFTGPALTITPTYLVLTQTSNNMCRATQTIANNTTQTVGWMWQPPKAPAFHFQINGGPVVAWPSTTTYVAAGGQATLVVTASCQSGGSFSVVALDSFGGQYAITMTVTG